LETLNGLARMNARYEFGASEKYETRRAGQLSGSQTLASKGRGRAALTHGSGRSALATSSREWSQTQRWLVGAAWASSAWRGASQAMAVVGDRDEEECSNVVAQAQGREMNFMWLYFFMLCIISILVSIVCFLSGWYASSWWHGRVDDRAVAERVRPDE